MACLSSSLTHDSGGWLIGFLTGSVVRVAPNRLMFNSVTALQDIYLNPQVVKGVPYHYAPLSTSQRGVQNTIDKETHRKKRKVIGYVLNERSMRIFEPTMSARIDEFLQFLYDASRSQQVINMAQLSQYLAMDIAASLGFGHSFNFQTQDTYRFIPETLIEWMNLININMQFPTMRFLSRALLVLQARKSARFGVALKKVVQARMAQGREAQHDFYSVATEIKTDAEFFRSELWAEATAFLAAGGLSTATAISATLFYLSRYPECYHAVAREVRTTFASSDDIKAGPRLNSCQYMRACIEEALRCAAPVLLPSWREQAPTDKGPFVVDGHIIPRGTQVSVPVYSLFHNEDIFEDPYSYRPERWLEPEQGTVAETGDRKASKEAMRKAFVPFMLGDRNCAGQAMAWMELSLVIARTLWYFDFEQAPGRSGKVGENMHVEAGQETPVYQIRDIFVAEHDGPNLVFRGREEVVRELPTKGR
ncbi:hypothetical protein HIM_01572 [Hirsutella minnesotensis 3608]|nr:hypothetical protein HIM_01572 [Hirsutella minnesotensis 3608]